MQGTASSTLSFTLFFAKRLPICCNFNDATYIIIFVGNSSIVQNNAIYMILSLFFSEQKIMQLLTLLE
jgi:hypothetical protein